MKIEKNYTLIAWTLALAWLLYSLIIWFSTSIWKVEDLHQLIGSGLIFIAISFTHFPRTTDKISFWVILFTLLNLAFGIFAWHFPSTMHSYWNYAFLSFGLHLILSIDDGIMQFAQFKWTRYATILLGIATCLPALLISGSSAFHIFAVITLLGYSGLVLFQLFKRTAN